MRILVTGGAGFLGSHLIESLLNLEHEVIALDNLFTGTKKNLESLNKLKNFRFVEQDVTNPLDFEVEGIFNLACPASPVHYQADPIRTVRTNVQGAINVLELASKTNARVFQASTSEIYGDPAISPQNESYWGNVNPIGIRSCYDEGKRVAETLFMDYRRQRNIDIRIARIFNTYGPNMSANDGRVVSNFIVQALLGNPLSVYGDGAQTRSFCYVSDLIEGIIKLFASDYSQTPVNLGNPTPIPMIELAEKVISLTGSKSRIEFLPLPEDDPRRREPDISVAKNQLDWTPRVELESGLNKTIEYFRKQLNT
jgi:UDP-glucuronate decarboxylase